MTSSLHQEITADSPTGTPAPAKRPRIETQMENNISSVCNEVEISRGAEGLVTRIPFLGRIAVRKERFPKRYRHPELDSKLTSRRVSQEARMLLRLRKAGICVPAVYRVDLKINELILEYLPGQTLKAFLQQENLDEGVGESVMRAAGKEVARMHKCGVVHGDLTTGNIMVVSDEAKDQDGGGNFKVVVIDFGLSGGNANEEDMAVDLYVLERAVISAHSETAQPLNDAFLESYGKEWKKRGVLTRLEEVRSRGRKRDMTG